MWRVGVYTNRPLLAEGLASVLSRVPELELVWSSNDLGVFTDQAERDQPEVLLVDLCSEVSLGTLTEIRRRVPGAHLVLWVQSMSAELAHQLWGLGIRGLLRTDLSIELTIRCLTKVAEGEVWLDRTTAASLLTAEAVHLTPRERQLLQLVAQGFGNKQIGSTLMLTEGTVKGYLSRLFVKLGVHDRFELALYALRNFSLAASDGIAPQRALEKGLPNGPVVERARSRLA